MHVCFFPFRLNANTANTHHQALRGCRAKGSGDLEVEALQQSSLMVFTEGKKTHIRDPYCAGFLKLMGPKTFVISLRTNISYSERLLFSLPSKSYSLQDSNSLSRQLLFTLGGEERSFLHLPRGD